MRGPVCYDLTRSFSSSMRIYGALLVGLVTCEGCLGGFFFFENVKGLREASLNPAVGSLQHWGCVLERGIITSICKVLGWAECVWIDPWFPLCLEKVVYRSGDEGRLFNVWLNSRV